MKKIKGDKVPQQMSKISDFFSKVPTNHIFVNGTRENKRKISETTHPGSIVLNSVTNLPEKCNERDSPTCKRIKRDENYFPPLSDNNVCKTESPCKSVGDHFQIRTPEKDVKPSSSMKTPTPKTNPGSDIKKTPGSSRKGTPKKLFEKSPRKLEEFNVKLLEAFVNISPSTSNRKIVLKSTPSKSCVQESIKKYISPAKSKRFSPAQNFNEITPTKLRQLPKAISPKVKTRLDFSEKNNVTPKKEKMEEDNYKLSNSIKEEVNDFFEDDFEALLRFEDDFKTLNLNEPQHCTILEVNKSNETTVLKIKSNKNSCTGSCRIEEFWASGNHFSAGDSVYISAEKIDNNWVVNNTKGWLIYEPDLLIPCTTVVGSLFCKRKSVLSDRFRGFDSDNRVMIIGVITHTLLQKSLKDKLKTAKEIEALLTRILQSKDTIKRLYESNLTYEEVETELQTFVPKLVTFINEYVNNSGAQPQPGDWQGNICGIDDIEENLWCPELGVKGKIDVTVQTNGGTMPLELKTGRASMSLEHRGQVMLYIMMMNKFGYQVSSGLLLYLREGVLKEIKMSPQEQRDIIILRNELAYFLIKNSSAGVSDIITPPELPEPLNNHRICSKCPYNILCTSYLKFENIDISRNKSIQDVQKNVTSHLAQSHLDYFFLWTNLISMEQESNQLSKSIRQIYTVPPAKREASGRCIINMKIMSVVDKDNGLYEHTLQKEDPNSNLTVHDIGENNYIVVSTDKRPAVATGYVTEISSSKISIILDRDLAKKYPDQFFHLDTYDSNITFTFNLTSLALLLESTPRAAELREIIIDKKPPTFLSKLPSVVAKKGAGILKRLNIAQQKAVLKALCANQYLLIKGMPGTGKSATIVALIQLSVELDRSVLITSHTHSAIDNICTRLQKRGIDFLRLGSESRIDPRIKPNSETILTSQCTSPQELEEFYNKYKVVAVSCLGSGHPLLSKRTFDVCIVDESTQVIQTSTIRPLYAAKSFILIGDPNQLCPLVKNRKALKGGMSESLFERLENSQETIVLNLNYRMNQTITDLANVLTYKGELKPANDEIANKAMEIPNIEEITTSYKDHKWLLKAMDTSLQAAVQLIDTGPVWKQPEDVKWHLNLKFKEYDTLNCINVYEIAVVVTIVKALIKGGVSNSDIGVIATYRAQVSQMSDFLEDLNVEVSTVDQFQGRDKSIIIYSCTKSTDPSREASKIELLEDKRRLTVAITRAKRKLLIVGDVITLQRFSTFSVILPTLKNNIIKFDSSWSLVNNF